LRIRRRDTRVVGGQSTDELIATLLIGRDPRAVELAYDQWSQLTYAVALALVGSPAAAEQIVEAAYLMLWREPEMALTRYENPRDFLLERVFYGAHQIHYPPHDSPLRRSPYQASHTDIEPFASPANLRADGPSQQSRTRERRHSFFHPTRGGST
jgi:hypothetical protein